MYVKLINEYQIEYPPVNKDNISNYNLNEELLVQDGYKILVEAEKPEGYYKAKYTEKTKYIYQEWEDISEEIEQQHKQWILSLYMTRSDFFDGMIMAFNVGETELKQAIINVLNVLELPEVQKKKALNNYDNALNFYRKHPLFTMLSNTPIPVEQNVVIQITNEQWDNFFIKTYEKDENAYKELLPQENSLVNE